MNDGVSAGAAKQGSDDREEHAGGGAAGSGAGAPQDESGATSGLGQASAMSQAGTMSSSIGTDDDGSLLHAEDGAGVGEGRDGEGQR